MRTLALFLGLLVMSIVIACDVPALQPIYTTETLTFEPALLGNWHDSDNTSYTFSDNGGGGYDLLMVNSDGVKSAFSVYLALIGGVLYGDMYPRIDMLGLPENLASYGPWDYAGLHNVYVIDQIRPALKLRQLSGEWFRAYIADNPAGVAYGDEDSSGGGPMPILTGSTAELQEFYAQHLNTPDAFTELGEITPAQGESPQAGSDEQARNVARTMCSAQMAYYASNGSYAQNLEQLAAPPPYIDPSWSAGQISGGITVELTQTSTQDFDIVVHSPTGRSFHVDESGLISEPDAPALTAAPAG